MGRGQDDDSQRRVGGRTDGYSSVRAKRVQARIGGRFGLGFGATGGRTGAVVRNGGKKVVEREWNAGVGDVECEVVGVCILQMAL